MAGGKLALAVALLGAAGVVFWINLRKRDRMYSVQDIAYATVCEGCRKEGSLTTREMTRLIDAGAVISPQYQLRRFHCPACGQTNVIMKAGIPDVRSAPKE